MKIIIGILFILTFGIVARAEDLPLVRESMSLSLQIRQKPGTEELLKSYLSPIQADRDTLYAILYEPEFCPRCEVMINYVGHLLKNESQENRLLLITAYTDSTRAAAYNKAKGYAANYYLYDTGNTFLDIFSFNSGGLSGVYVLKICKPKGELLTEAINYYALPEYIKELTKWTERMAPTTMP